MAVVFQKSFSPREEAPEEEPEEGEISDDDHDSKEDNNVEVSDKLSDLDSSKTSPLLDIKKEITSSQAQEIKKPDNLQKGLLGRKEGSKFVRDRITWGENKSWERSSSFSTLGSNYYNLAWAQGVQERSSFLTKGLQKDESFYGKPIETSEYSIENSVSEEAIERQVYPLRRSRSLKERLSTRSSETDNGNEVTGSRAPLGFSKSSFRKEALHFHDSKLMRRRKGRSSDEQSESSERDERVVDERLKERSDVEADHFTRSRSRGMSDRCITLKSRIEKVDSEATESDGDRGSIRLAKTEENENSTDTGSFMQSEEQATAPSLLMESSSKEQSRKRGIDGAGGDLEEGEIELASSSRPCPERFNEILHTDTDRGPIIGSKRWPNRRSVKKLIRPQSRSRSGLRETLRQGHGFERKHQEVVETENERERHITWVMELMRNTSVKDAQRSFIGVCEQLIKAVEVLEKLCGVQPYQCNEESESPELISRLARQAFDGIRAVYAVRNTAIGREQERDRIIFPRLLELSIGSVQKLFTFKQARELEAMMQAISSHSSVPRSDSVKSLDGLSQVSSILEKNNARENKVSDASENPLVKEKFASCSETESFGGTYVKRAAIVPENKQASDAAALAAAAVAYARSSTAIYSPEDMNQSVSETYSRAKRVLPLEFRPSPYGARMDPFFLAKGGDTSHLVGLWSQDVSGISDAANIASKPSYQPWAETSSWQFEQTQEPLPSSYRQAVFPRPGFENAKLHFNVQDPRHHPSTSPFVKEVERSDISKFAGVDSTIILPTFQGTPAVHSDPERLRSSAAELRPSLSYKVNITNPLLFTDRLPSPTPSEEDLEAQSSNQLASEVPLNEGDEPTESSYSQMGFEGVSFPGFIMPSASNENADERQWMDASRLIVDLNCEGAVFSGSGSSLDEIKPASDKNLSDSPSFGPGIALKSRDPRRHLTTIAVQGSNLQKNLQPPKLAQELGAPEVSQISELGSKKREATSDRLRGLDAKRSRMAAENTEFLAVDVFEEPSDMEVDSEDATLNTDQSTLNLGDSLEREKKQILSLNQSYINSEVDNHPSLDVSLQINDFSLIGEDHATETIPINESSRTNFNTMGSDLVDIKGDVQGLKSTTNLMGDINRRRMKLRDPRRVLLESNSSRPDVSNYLNSGGGNLVPQNKLQRSSSLTLQQNITKSSEDDQMANNLSSMLASQSFPQETALPNIAPSFMEKLASLAEILGSKGNYISGKSLSVSMPVVGPTPIVEKILEPELSRKGNASGLSGVDAFQTHTLDSIAVVPSNKLTEGESTARVVNRQDKTPINHASMQGYMDLDHLLKDLTEDERLAIQQERLRRMEEQERMLSARKLCLVLDLDHTLLNSAKFSEIDPEWEQRLRATEAAERNRDGSNLVRRELYRFPHMNMWTKLRPGIRKFLDRASQLYELHVYTMGNKAYATEMAKLLDPTGTLFAGRVISKGDESDSVSGDDRPPKSKDLDGVLGMESAVVIIDDSARVWPHHRDNLIVVERYMYFPCSRRQFGLPGPSLLEVGHDEREADGMIASTLTVIGTIHQNFFSNQRFREMDVRQILATEQHKVLGGCRIMFSRIFPVGEAQPHRHYLWQMAEQFGATCTTKLENNITHVVALSLGTDKVKWALANGRFVVRPAWLEASAVLYRRANERDFPVPP